jgi:hypothetical protein
LDLKVWTGAIGKVEKDIRVETPECYQTSIELLAHTQGGQTSGNHAKSAPGQVRLQVIDSANTQSFGKAEQPQAATPQRLSACRRLLRQWHAELHNQVLSYSGASSFYAPTIMNISVARLVKMKQRL